MQIFTDHLESGGWLVITGHGNAGVEDVRGAYMPLIREEDAVIEKLDVSCSAENFVNLVMQSKKLQPGDRINVLLSVCLAARAGTSDGNKLSPSFAEKLGAAFAGQGIHSNIVASTGVIGRIGKYSESAGDVKHEKLVFRADTNAIRIFYRDADSTTPLVLSPGEKFYITTNGIGCGEQLKTQEQILREYDEKLIQAVLKLNIGIDEQALRKNFNVCKASAILEILRTENSVVVRRSQSHLNTISISYPNPKQKGEYVSSRVTCFSDGAGGLKIENEEKAKKFIKKHQAPQKSASAAAISDAPTSIWQKEKTNKTEPALRADK